MGPISERGAGLARRVRPESHRVGSGRIGISPIRCSSLLLEWRPSAARHGRPPQTSGFISWLHFFPGAVQQRSTGSKTRLRFPGRQRRPAPPRPATPRHNKRLFVSAAPVITQLPGEGTQCTRAWPPSSPPRPLPLPPHPARSALVDGEVPTTYKDKATPLHGGDLTGCNPIKGRCAIYIVSRREDFFPVFSKLLATY